MREGSHFGVVTVTAEMDETKKTKWSAFRCLPTPNDLATAQREYAARGIKHEKNKDGVPDFFPPPTTKDQVFNEADYADIDDRASNTPREVSCGTIQSVVDYLIAGTTNDIGKVRSIFVWIASQEGRTYTVIQDDSLDNALNMAIMAQTDDRYYNKLFHDMCGYAGIPCHKVEGALKTFDRIEDTEFPFGNGEWCIVFVDGAWRFVDQACGSTGLIGGKTDWEAIDTDAKFVDSQQEATTVYTIIEKWFLTDPELFIYTHYPPNLKMQLLAKPITHEEFNSMAEVCEEYFENNIEDMSETRAHISTKEGKVEVWFKPSTKQNITMRYILYRHTDNQESEAISKCVRLENRDDGRPVFTVFIKSVGLYKLEIQTSKGIGNRTTLVEYIIRCNSPYFGDVSLPHLSELQEIGPGAAWKSMGISTNIEGGIIKATKGQAKLQLKSKDDMNVSFKLTAEDEDNDAFQQCTLLDKNKENHTLFLRLPSHGPFLLTARTGEEHEPPNCNFLVESDMACVTGLFPKELQESAGSIHNGTTFFQLHKKVSVLSVSKQKDDFMLELPVLSDATYEVQLLYCDGDHVADLSDYVWFYKSPSTDVLQIQCRFKFAGQYILNIFSKEDASALVWRYFLEVEHPSACYLPFPEKLTHWKQDFKLEQPLVRYLGLNTDVTFKVHILEAANVELNMNEGNVEALQLQASHKFSGNVHTVEEEGIITMNAALGGMNKECLRYQVFKASELASLAREHVKNKEKARTKKKKLEAKLAFEEKQVKIRAEEAKQREKRKKKEFDAKKKELFAEEKRREDREKEERFIEKLSLKLTPGLLAELLGCIRKDLELRSILAAILLLLGEVKNNNGDLSLESIERLVESLVESRHEIYSDGYHLCRDMIHIRLEDIDAASLQRSRKILSSVNRMKIMNQYAAFTPIMDWLQACTESYWAVVPAHEMVLLALSNTLTSSAFEEMQTHILYNNKLNSLLTAVLLMLGHTAEPRMTVLGAKEVLHRVGVKRVMDQMLNFNLEKSNDDLMQKAVKLMDDFDYDEVRENYPVLLPITDWVTACLQSYKDSRPAQEEESQECLTACRPLDYRPFTDFREGTILDSWIPKPPAPRKSNRRGN